MARNAPTPVRFEAEVAQRLASFAASHPGLSISAATNLLVDEALRAAEQPGVIFRDGPTGRRAGLAGGPDVWEVVRAVKATRAADPDCDEDELLALVTGNTGVPIRMVRIALNYWANFPSEIDIQIVDADAADASAETAWRRQRGLLSG